MDEAEALRLWTADSRPHNAPVADELVRQLDQPGVSLEFAARAAPIAAQLVERHVHSANVRLVANGDEPGDLLEVVPGGARAVRSRRDELVQRVG